MSTVAIPSSLNPLVEFLNSLKSRVPIEQLHEHLIRLALSEQDLAHFALFGDTCYRRNLIVEGDWYELLCICWRSGQRSPIHNHANSTCGLRVIKGICTETSFEPTPCGQLKPTRSVDYYAGSVCCTQDADVHQVSNLQQPGKDLMTVHIYSPPLRTMDTFSITGEHTGSYAPGSPCPESVDKEISAPRAPR